MNAALTVPRRALALTAQVFKSVESQLAGGQGEGKGLETIDKLDFISTLKHCQKKKKTSYRLEEDICRRQSDKRLLARIYKELLGLYNKRANHLIKNKPNCIGNIVDNVIITLYGDRC